MNSDPIVSFSTPLPATDRVEILPAPVLELAYAYYYLLERHAEVRSSELPWVTSIHRTEAALVERLGAFWSGEEASWSGNDLFVMACELGYAKDRTPGRFLDDLPTLQEPLLERLEHERRETNKKGWEHHGTFRRRLQSLQDPERAEAFRGNLRRLWDVLKSPWGREGRQLVEQACRDFSNKFGASGDVMSALLAHHFTQFEIAASRIRASQSDRHIVVTPLYFAASGGFDFELHETHYIGYGLRSESTFEDTASSVAEMAARHKSFADPTRLMLLALIARWHRMPMTVGDLAAQLGVSQPTVSGHLKILREAGFVQLQKKGNRSYHRVDADAVREALRELAEALLEYVD